MTVKTTATFYLLAALCNLPLAAQSRAALTAMEEDRIREAQEPGERIVVYLDLLDTRLARFDDARRQPVDTRYDQPRFIRELLGEYVALNEELKDWIEHHYERMGDMRGGLRKLIERAPQQLVVLRGIQESGDPHSAHYANSLREAIDNLSDTVDGATVALAEQTKKFGELKRQEKVDRQRAKERAKEESKRTKEEKKARKQPDGKRTVPGETPEE